jgi:hypothetical protein
MSLYGAPLIVGTVCARAAVSAFCKIPLSNALVYNCVDMIIVAVVHVTLSNYLLSQIKGNKHTRGWLGQQITANVAPIIVSRIGGALIGVGVSRALDCPVRPFHATVITYASFMVVLMAIASGSDLKHLKLV